MKNILLVFLTAAIITFKLFAQESNMEEVMKLAQPGPEHELLKKFEGNWNLNFKYDMGNGTIMDGKGTSTGKIIMSGRFLTIESNTEAMGLKIAALNIMGFDRRFNKYTLYGIDEMGTYGVNPEGVYNSVTKILTLKGIELDPTGKTNNTRGYRFEYNLSKENEIKIDLIFSNPDGSDWRIMEMWMTR